MPDREKDHVAADYSSNDGKQGSARGRYAPGTAFKDIKGNAFYYDTSGRPRYFGLDINGTPPQPASSPNATAQPGIGLAEPIYKGGTGSRPRTLDFSTTPGLGNRGATPQPMDDTPSYDVNSGDYQIAARKAFSDYSNALARGDVQAQARAQREMIANPPQGLKPDTRPQMQSYDPNAAALRAQRFQTDLLGAISLPAAEMGGLAYMLGKDEDTRRRWMEGAAEISAELSPFLATKVGLLRDPAARNSLKPVGVPGDIGVKGATLEGAATLDAYQRGAVKTFNGKYGGDNGFDGAYVMRNQDGDPQLHIDSVKAVKGRVAVYGSGSMTELGTNRAATRGKAESALKENIKSTEPDENFSPADKRAVLDQLDRGEVVANLVGMPETLFTQDHIDFINNETPYRFGTVRKLDPFSPSKEPLLDGASYGLPSVYWQDIKSSSGSPPASGPTPTSEKQQ